MQRSSILIPLCLAALAVGAQGSPDPDTTTADPIISAEAAHQLVGKAGVTFLHVGRDDSGYTDAHIPGALFLPLSAFTEERDGVPFELPDMAQLRKIFETLGVQDHGRVVIYSDGSLGDIETLAAARAYVSLDVLGHPYVAVLDGGFEAWRRAGYQVTQDSSLRPTTSIETTSRQDSLIVAADDLVGRLSDDSLFLADARPLAEYSGEQAGTDVLRPGHIPGARNLFWKDFLTDDGTLKSVEELARMWHEAGLKRGDDVVVYCRTGMQASYAYLVARYLGLSPRLYDASYIDWSNNTDYPVAP